MKIFGQKTREQKIKIWHERKQSEKKSSHPLAFSRYWVNLSILLTQGKEIK